MSSTILTIQSIKKRKDFLYLSNKGKSIVTPAFVIKYAIPSRIFHDGERSVPQENGVRIGYVVRKKIGTAVIRNRVRRRFREIVRKVMPEFACKGYDYVIIARSYAVNRDFNKIKNELIEVLQKLKTSIDSCQKKDEKE